MGMSSSQARLLTLTARVHQIEYEGQRLQSLKLQMGNESSRVYEEYVHALDAKKVQYKSVAPDGTATFKDASFDDLYFGRSGVCFALFKSDSGKALVSNDIEDAFKRYPTSPSDFATELAGYTPSSSPKVTSQVAPIVGTPSAEYSPPAGYHQADNTDIVLIRKDSSQNNVDENITVGSSITLMLKNNITSASDYVYTIANNGTDTTSLSVQYLDNGRLVISGSGLTITANGSQNDDIILLGSDNTLNTGNGDDIVRVADCRDARGNYLGLSQGNTVSTGLGDDHVTVADHNNIFNDSDGGTLFFNNTDIISTISAPSSMKSINGTSNADITSQTLGSSTIEGYSAQVMSSDCRLFSLINSLGNNTNNGNLSAYAQVSKNSDGTYKVNFPNYSGSGVGYLDNIDPSDIENSVGVTGDLTTVLIDYAINKLMYINKDDDDLKSSETTETNAFSRAQYGTISKYIFGNDYFTMYIVGKDGYSQQDVADKAVSIWNDKISGSHEVTNLLVGFNTTNNSLGIISNHAYSVKNIVMSGSDISYVELVNPWDDGDILRLDGETFISNLKDCYTFGSSYYDDSIVYRNVTSSSISEPAETNSLVVVNNTVSATNSSDEKWYFYYHLHESMQKGYELMPEDMRTSSIWLRNALESGYAYLKTYDRYSQDLVSTNVATHTYLREEADKTELKRAEAKYEADLLRIDNKERRIDAKLASYDNERKAIEAQIDSLTACAKENVEFSFKLFS